MNLEFPYYSTKTYSEAFPVAYRQWRADSHCNVVHGYALSIHLEFGAADLDARNWVVDFGSLKPLKDDFSEWFDHTLLVAQDDPKREILIALRAQGLAKVVEVERTGCEGLSDFIFNYINGPDGWLKIHGYWPRVVCTKVEVRETSSNMAMRTLTRNDYANWSRDDHVHMAGVGTGVTRAVLDSGTNDVLRAVRSVLISEQQAEDDRLRQQAERA